MSGFIYKISDDGFRWTKGEQRIFGGCSSISIEPPLSKDHVYATRPKQDPHQQLMTTEQLSIKVKFGEDLRRFCVRRDITFIDLVRFITQQFGFDEDQAQLKYIDDEEEVFSAFELFLVHLASSLT